MDGWQKCTRELHLTLSSRASWRVIVQKGKKEEVIERFQQKVCEEEFRTEKIKEQASCMSVCVCVQVNRKKPLSAVPQCRGRDEDFKKMYAT